MMAHLHANSAGGAVSSGVQLTKLADRSHRTGDDLGFQEDGCFRLGLSSIELDLRQTERLVRWAQRELGERPSLFTDGPRSRPSALAHT
jgi:hypothetical protein